MKKLGYLLVILFTLVITGCSTIVNGTSHKLNVNSNVNQAKVYINGVYKGNAPVFLNLSKSEGPYTVTIEAPGYQTYTTTVNREVSGWVWGNIIVGGPIGLLIDAVSGGIYTYNTDTVFGYLDKQQVGQMNKN